LRGLIRITVLALCFAGLVSSCGGGDGDDSPELSGTWFGTMEDGQLNLHTIAFAISGTSITAIVRDGVVTGRTGAIIHQSGQAWMFVLNDQTEGAFFVDASATHATFADEEFSFGVLQKGAASLGTYAATDINGSWSGSSAETDFQTAFQVASSAACDMADAVDCMVTSSAGTSSVTFGGSFNTTFGRWTGSYTGPAVGQSGTVHAFISPDKQFVGAWACDNPNQDWPGDCAFSAWRR
jgi:hypothetical protein